MRTWDFVRYLYRKVDCDYPADAGYLMRNVSGSYPEDIAGNSSILEWKHSIVGMLSVPSSFPGWRPDLSAGVMPARV